MEKRPRVLSQFKEAEPAKEPPLLNWTDPVEPPGVTTVEGTQTLFTAKQPAPRFTPPPKVEVAVPMVTMASPVKVMPLATMPPPKVEEAVVLVTFKVPTERPLVIVEVPDPATERSPEKVPPPVTVRPFEEKRPAVWKPPATVEEAPVPVKFKKEAWRLPVKVLVALTVETKLPPPMVMPPVVTLRSSAWRPPAKVEVATLVWLMELPVMVRPLDEERPAVFTPPWKVEEAEPLPVTRSEPETESCWPGEVVPTPTLPCESIVKAVDVAFADVVVEMSTSGEVPAAAPAKEN